MSIFRISHFIKYSITHAPWALVHSLSHGVANYIILIIISKFYGIEGGGEFRLLLSIFAMLNLFTLTDSGKVAVKYLVQGECGVIRPLVQQRIYWGLLGTLVGLVVTFVYFTQDNEIWVPVLVLSLCIPLTAPMNLFVQINQSKRNFRLNAIYVLMKYAIIVPLCTTMGVLGYSLYWFFAAFFVISAAINIVCLRRHHELFEPSNAAAQQYRRESLQLSATGIFPQILEHLDKFLISYFFGLEALGIYTIGVSTGVLLLRFIKPTLTIYFPYLVEHKLDWKIFASGFVALSLIAAITIYFLPVYFDEVLGPEFESAKLLAYVIVAGLGVSFLGVISYFSAVYHKDGSAKIPAITNVVTAAITASYLLCAALFGGDYALVLCAASYPLRDFLNLLVIQFIDRWARRGRGHPA